MVDPVSIGAAVGWGVSAVGWLASPIISRVLNKGFAHLDFDATEKVKILDLQVLQLQRVMEVVDKSTYRVRLEPLLDKLKSALYKAEDILDAVEYQRLEKQIQDGSMPQRKRDWLKKNLMSAGTSSPVTDMISKVKLKKSLEKIASAISDACKVLEQLNLQGVSNDNGRRAVATNSRGAVTTTAPLLRVLGRDQDRDKIIAMLHENTVNGTYYSVIGIHGIAGSGKSTLAKCVYDHEKRNKQEKAEGHFDIIMWIHVSQKFDLESIFREMFEGATRKKCDKFNSCNTLKENLEEELHGKRILLVLDDVWYNNRNSGDREELQKLISPLNVGKAGSRILVTSRTEAALVALGAVKERCIPISDLDDDAFLEMFKHYALPHPWSGGNDRKTLEMIGKYIAKNLKKSPLAARTVGSRLRETQTVEFWMSQKDRDLMKNTMGSLWWSYQYLDEQVRRCFAYCSIFPRRHCLYRDELVKLWVAEGFIKTTNPEEEMEDVAQEYLDELLSASFLQFGGEKYKINYFTIHDLLFDLAEEVAGRDCFRIEEGFTGEVPQDVRYLFVGAYDREMLTEKISGLQNLRTLIIDDVIWVNSRDEFKVFLRLSKLRVLKLSVIMNIGKFGLLARTFSFPDSIGDLKHLRYLAFHTLSEHIILPHTFSKLYHIQVVDFGVCANLEFSSGEDMMNLINLRRVISKADLEFSNIGRLTWLQMLPFFTIKRKHGYESRQLKHLNKLQGKLQIHGLENIQNKEEAVEVNLADKEKLTELVLVWDHDDSWCSPGVQAEVLEGLCPSKYLKRLEIRNYHGKRIPTWLMGKHNGSPKNLQELRFSRCSWDWDALPEHLTLLKNAIMCDRW